MHSLCSTIVVATLVTDMRVHDAMTMGAFQGLWYFPSVVWNFNVVADVFFILKNLVMVIFESQFEVLLV